MLDRFGIKKVSQLAHATAKTLKSELKIAGMRVIQLEQLIDGAKKLMKLREAQGLINFCPRIETLIKSYTRGYFEGRVGLEAAEDLHKALLARLQLLIFEPGKYMSAKSKHVGSSGSVNAGTVIAGLLALFICGLVQPFEEWFALENEWVRAMLFKNFWFETLVEALGKVVPKLWKKVIDSSQGFVGVEELKAALLAQLGPAQRSENTGKNWKGGKGKDGKGVLKGKDGKGGYKGSGWGRGGWESQNGAWGKGGWCEYAGGGDGGGESFSFGDKGKGKKGGKRQFICYPAILLGPSGCWFRPCRDKHISGETEEDRLKAAKMSEGEEQRYQEWRKQRDDKGFKKRN